MGRYKLANGDKIRDYVTPRTFGIELEVVVPARGSRDDTAEYLVRKLAYAGVPAKWFGYTHNVEEKWKIVTDCSISPRNYQTQIGYEIVSPILTWDRINEVETVCRVLRELGAEVNFSTGLHVHHDISDYKAENILSLLELYISCEGAIDEIVHDTRRGNVNGYCKSMFRLNPKRIRARIARIARIHGVEPTVNNTVSAVLTEINDEYDTNAPRYMKLNFASYRSYRTVEFRHHHGTLDGYAIKSWILLTQRMVETAMTGGTFSIKPRKFDAVLRVLQLSRRVGPKEFVEARKYFDAFHAVAADSPNCNQLFFFGVHVPPVGWT